VLARRERAAPVFSSVLPLRVSRVTAVTASLLVTVGRSLRVPVLVRSALTELSAAATDESPAEPPLLPPLTPTLKSAV
jgi:hypothetical protein